ncbi:MAG: hypothetical protein ACXWME_10645, partial [Syntrophales bacterium]
MKICTSRHIIVGFSLLLMMLPSSAYPQQNKNAAEPLKSKAAAPQKIQGEIATDSDQYIIGPE